MTSAPSPGMFGLRLGCGLHLGHLVGNVSPALEEMHRRPIYVILADLFTRTSGRGGDVTLDNACAMVAECMALGLVGNDVKYVAQSVVFESIMPLYFVLSCLLPFGRLKATRPLGRMLENPKGLCFGELAFPVAQCAEMISTRSEILFSNTDNLGLVTLAKELSAKLAKATSMGIPKPRLVHGNPMNLRGLDHKKMSVGQGNAIFLSDAPERVRSRIIAVNTALTPGLDVDLSLIYEYLAVAGMGEEGLGQVRQEFTDGSATALQLKNRLADELTTLLADIQLKKAALYDRSSLIERIRSDTEDVRKDVRGTVRLIMSSLSDGEFQTAFNVGSLESGDG